MSQGTGQRDAWDEPQGTDGVAGRGEEPSWREQGTGVGVGSLPGGEHPTARS